MVSRNSQNGLIPLLLSIASWQLLAIATAAPVGSQPDNGCHGMLSNPCRCTAVAVECINSQFTDTDIFLQVSKIHFPFLETVTFQGNNFINLPPNVFGPASNHPRLTSLNLSANYFVHLHQDAFKGMPELKFLDLSDNEIILDEKMLYLLHPLQKLQSLRLRKAFRFPMNVTNQLGLFQEILEKAQLEFLEELDLSWNYVDWLPPRLTCGLASLKRLILADNNLQVLDLEPACLQRLTILDLSRNAFNRLDVNFMRILSQLPDLCAVSMYQNPFHCDCKSRAYLEWFRTTTKIHDADLLKCYSASPGHLLLEPLKKVPLDQLTCDQLVTTGTAIGLTPVSLIVIATLTIGRWLFALG